MNSHRLYRGENRMISDERLREFAAGRKLLLIEDNEINALIAENQLKSVGFEVEWVTDGQQGVKMYMDSPSNHFSCIITDLMMPVMDGVETAKHVRQSGRDDAGIPILAITANSYAGKDAEYKESGIAECITKPYKKQELLEWVYTNVSEYEGIDVSGNEEN